MSLEKAISIAAAAHGDVGLLIFGLLLSLPLIVWERWLLAGLMDRWPFIIWIGGGVLGLVAAEIIFHDVKVREWLGPAVKTAHAITPITLAVIITGIAWWFARNTARENVFS